jgi:histidinol-phosphate/aromatic aminotransferase/cobyric acid decarboxylase-like protein
MAQLQAKLDAVNNPFNAPVMASMAATTAPALFSQSMVRRR